MNTHPSKVVTKTTKKQNTRGVPVNDVSVSDIVGERALGARLTMGIGQPQYKAKNGIWGLKVVYITCNVDNRDIHPLSDNKSTKKKKKKKKKKIDKLEIFMSSLRAEDGTKLQNQVHAIW